MPRENLISELLAKVPKYLKDEYHSSLFQAIFD
jgi:hypothetical protein